MKKRLRSPMGNVEFNTIHKDCWASYFLLAIFSESLLLIVTVKEGRHCVQCFPNLSTQGPFFLQNLLWLAFQRKHLGKQ